LIFRDAHIDNCDQDYEYYQGPFIEFHRIACIFDFESVKL
jgi:hypothetical protein